VVYLQKARSLLQDLAFTMSGAGAGACVHPRSLPVPNKALEGVILEGLVGGVWEQPTRPAETRANRCSRSLSL